MPRIIHCADLHLSVDEREYSLGVLDEIVGVARDKKADVLVFAGDLFDSFADAHALRGDVRKHLAPLENRCRGLFVPGNHEFRGNPNANYGTMDFSPLTLARAHPFELVELSGIEFLCIPHQPDYSAYQQWEIPQKSLKPRVAVAHAQVPGLAGYTGMSEEEEIEAGAMDPGLFARCKAEYAALGHIHKRGNRLVNGVHIHYPGSARVWRSGETGERMVIMVTLDNGIAVESIPLSSAGEYRYCEIPLGFDGKAEVPAEMNNGAWGVHDYIEIRLSGFVEDEHSAADYERELVQLQTSSRIRKIKVERDAVTALSGISTKSIAKRFLAEWKKREPGEAAEKARWLKAREIGLKTISGFLRGAR
jgi:DNA repair exonuclease SbcCD nuclease subunit